MNPNAKFSPRGSQFANEHARQLKVAPVTAWRWSAGHRLAVVACPYCSAEHEHVVPTELAIDAPLIREARCTVQKDRRHGTYRLALPDDGSTSFTRDPIDPETDPYFDYLSQVLAGGGHR
ncbi:hypothetical protein [Kribbella sp. DT2]|uniref:hypothetical protein n=1 Tax=Kribbella sp. DT2 TaxID=3393427 RepID=UPI003CF8F503